MGGIGTRWPIIDDGVAAAEIAGALEHAAVDGVVLLGPAGVGKTALADRVATLMTALDRPVRRLPCGPWAAR